MSDRTMIAVAGKSFSVPRLAKRLLQVLTAMGLTALVSLVIVVANSVLMSKGGSVQGLNTWLGFIQRADIIGTMLLTSAVTICYFYWDRANSGSSSNARR
jgi:hypothetical protein